MRPCPSHRSHNGLALSCAARRARHAGVEYIHCQALASGLRCLRALTAQIHRTVRTSPAQQCPRADVPHNDRHARHAVQLQLLSLCTSRPTARHAARKSDAVPVRARRPRPAPSPQLPKSRRAAIARGPSLEAPSCSLSAPARRLLAGGGAAPRTGLRPRAARWRAFRLSACRSRCHCWPPQYRSRIAIACRRITFATQRPQLVDAPRRAARAARRRPSETGIRHCPCISGCRGCSRRHRGATLIRAAWSIQDR